MPKAGKKHFPYTKAGKKKAKKYAKKRGLKVKGSKNPGYYAEGTIMNKEELAGESVWNTYRNIAHIFLGETVIPKTVSKKIGKVNLKKVKTQTRLPGRVDPESDERDA